MFGATGFSGKANLRGSVSCRCPADPNAELHEGKDPEVGVVSV